MRLKLLISLIVITSLVFVMTGCETIDTAKFNLSVNVEGEGGTVTEPGVGDYSMDYGTSVSLVVQADEGYEFSDWTGTDADDIVAEGDDYKIYINGPKDITANFSAEDDDDEQPTVSVDPLADLSGYSLKASPNDGTTVDGAVTVENVEGPEGNNMDVLSISASSGNSLEHLFSETSDFTQYSTITFYIKSDSDVAMGPIVQNDDWNFHKAPDVSATGDGQWHEVTIDPSTYGDEFSNGSDLDLSAIKKVAFEVTGDVDFYMTNPVGVPVQ
ncbi:MAG: InlB B-repeat-containing protein [Halanaerobiaceae bacterium]